MDGSNLAPGRGDVADEVALLVALADGRFCGGACDGDLPDDLSVLGGRHGVGLGMLDGQHLLDTHALASKSLVLGLLQVGLEALLGDAALVVAILAFVHGQLEELLVVLAFVPAFVLHDLAELVEFVGIVALRVGGCELASLLLGEGHDFGGHFAWELAALAQDHAPDGVVHHRVAGLAHRLGQQVHQGDVLRVLAEGRDEWGIAHLGPHVGHLVEELHQELVFAIGLKTLVLAVHVDGLHDAREVGHHRAHHAARQSAAQQERAHQLVARVHEVAQEVVDELLRQLARLHVGLHVDFGHLETGVLQHGLDGDDVGVHLAPRQGLDGRVDDVGTCLADLQDAGHREARTAVAMILDDDVGVLGLDVLHQQAEEVGASDACHVLEADFGCAGLDELVGDVGIIDDGMDGRVGDAERGLRNHACLLGVVDAGDDVAHVVQAAEDAGDVGSLGLLYLIHQTSDVGRHGVHAQGVQAAVEHVRLDAGLVQGGGKGADGLVGVLAIEQVHLFEGASVGLYAGEAAHLDDDGGDACQLVGTGLVLT